MIRLVLKSLRIVESEIYNNKLICYISNISILLLVIVLQFGDITWKVTGNNIILVWIAINVCLTFGVYLKNNREHILCVGALGNVKRYFFLILLSIITNVSWLFVLLFQLLVGFEANWLNAILITVMQYTFAISLGTVCGTLKKRGLGISLIGILGLYNFMFCNPYNYHASSHIGYVSESVITVNNLNVDSMINCILFALLFFALAYHNVTMNTKKKSKTVIFIIVFFGILYTAFLQSSLYQYQNGMDAEYEIYADNVHMKYKGISEMQMKDITNMIDIMEEEYCNVLGAVVPFDKINVQKQFLPEMIWLMKDLEIKPIEIKDNMLNINVVSPNMLYFENSDLLKNFLEDICLEMEVNIPDYNKSKFTRHIIEGYSVRILENVSEKLEIESSREVYDYYRESNDEMLRLPTTKFNYIKRIAYVIYSDYSEYADELYTGICEKKISSDEEFINLIKNDFNEIYENKKIVDMLNAIY